MSRGHLSLPNVSSLLSEGHKFAQGKGWDTSRSWPCALHFIHLIHCCSWSISSPRDTKIFISSNHSEKNDTRSNCTSVLKEYFCTFQLTASVVYAWLLKKKIKMDSFPHAEKTTENEFHIFTWSLRTAVGFCEQTFETCERYFFFFYFGKLIWIVWNCISEIKHEVC